MPAHPRGVPISNARGKGARFGTDQYAAPDVVRDVIMHMVRPWGTVLNTYHAVEDGASATLRGDTEHETFAK
jgi:hypothetical protein